MRLIKTFSFDSDNDMDVLEHCKLQENASSYIRDLIRADMCKKECLSVEDMVSCAVEKSFEKWHSKTQTAATPETASITSRDIYDELGLTVYFHAIASID